MNKFHLLLIAGTVAAILGFGALALRSKTNASTVSTPPPSSKSAESTAAQKAELQRDNIDDARLSRDEQWKRAIARGASWAGYPKTEEAVLRAFWDAASRKDYDTLTVLCPGSAIANYKKYYDQWPPSPIRSILPAEAHPRVQNVSLIPVKVDFPGFPNKTVKMAITKLPDGRIGIDGANTIWF